jgi:glycosyltransferase involved in cell wall biosynthesis
MKIFALTPDENWIVDRFVAEWHEYNKDICVSTPDEADVIWLTPAWCWRRLSTKQLSTKKVIATVHHIVPDKFGSAERNEFIVRDQFVTAYHVPCEKTKKQIQDLNITTKHIEVIPFWINQNLWFDIHDQKEILKQKHKLPNDSFLIGSFQRDTEGKDLKSPKLDKGPDIFCDIVENIVKTKNVHVVLTGWRRNYVIDRLTAAGIKHTFFNMVDFKTMNELYNCLDLYIVSSRHEGGPQAIFECALSKTPVISTDVGAASEYLSPKSIFSDKFRLGHPDTAHAFDSVQKLKIHDGMKPFREFFEII